MKEKWLSNYSDSATAQETPGQSSLLLALIFLTCACLAGLLSTSLSAQPNKNNAKNKQPNPITFPQLPTPPDHIEAIEPMPETAPTPAQSEPPAEKEETMTKSLSEAEKVLAAPPIIEPVMPVEIANAVAETPPAPAIPAELMDKISELESKVHALEMKQALFENELKQFRHQAEQPEEQDIEHSSAPLPTHKEIPSIEEISSEEEL